MIHDGEDADAAAADVARRAYEAAILQLVRRLHPKDFELLVDLILSRTGWARVAHRGGATEGVDIEAVNAAINELAFVQVKSTADQRVLADYVARFRGRARYQRMIFAVHTPRGELTADDPDVQIWDGPKIAELVVKHGLGDWVASRCNLSPRSSGDRARSRKERGRAGLGAPRGRMTLAQALEPDPDD